MDKEQIMWAVGLFEGEGCIFLTETKPNYFVPGITLTTTDEDVIRRFHRIIGMGRVRGPYNHKRPNSKPAYVWRLTGVVGVSEVLLAFAPWLGERRSARAAEVLAKSSKSKRAWKPFRPSLAAQ